MTALLLPHSLTSFCAVILFQVTAFFSAHPIHVSVSELNYSEKDRAVQITSRIFIDDLELSIRSQRQMPELDLMAPKNGFTTDQLVSDYLQKHLIVTLEGKQQKMKLLGTETEDLALICYIEIENVKKLKRVAVLNSVIMETHNDQSNLVHVTYKGVMKSARLTQEQPSEEFLFETK